jgi:2-iminobutanoate/2-iminopropanoate deaminase
MKEHVVVPGMRDPDEYGYSQCVKVGRTVYVAGQCGIGDDHHVIAHEFEPQARQAIERVRMALEAAGGTLDDVVAMTVFITDTRFGRVFTAMRAELFTKPYPTSALIGVSQLMPPGAMIEIQATAVLP